MDEQLGKAADAFLEEFDRFKVGLLHLRPQVFISVPLAGKYAALRQALSEQREGRWISVEERLPKPGAFVLCADSGGRVTQGQFCDLRHYAKPERCKKWDLYLFGKTDAVTHWMPLPAAPTTTATSGSKEEVKEQTEEESA